MSIVVPFLAALAVGLLVGIVFAAFSLPVPAPPTLGGVLGVAGTVFGMYLGYLLMEARI